MIVHTHTRFQTKHNNNCLVNAIADADELRKRFAVPGSSSLFECFDVGSLTISVLHARTCNEPRSMANRATAKPKSNLNSACVYVYQSISKLIVSVLIFHVLVCATYSVICRSQEHTICVCVCIQLVVRRRDQVITNYHIKPNDVRNCVWHVYYWVTRTDTANKALRRAGIERNMLSGSVEIGAHNVLVKTLRLRASRVSVGLWLQLPNEPWSAADAHTLCLTHNVISVRFAPVIAAQCVMRIAHRRISYTHCLMLQCHLISCAVFAIQYTGLPPRCRESRNTCYAITDHFNTVSSWT